jgi:hypothetical protein
MTTFSNAPQLLKGGLVLLDPETSALQRIIALQYNPDTLSRTLQPQGPREAADRAEALRLTGPPVETIKLDAEIDAIDQLEFPAQHPNAVQFGIQPLLAALETIVYPASAKLLANHAMAAAGMLEILPTISSLVLFVWSRHRIAPVRITDFSITEEAFDTSLNPIRAKVSLGLRVLSVTDIGFTNKGGSLFLAYQQQKEQLAAKNLGGVLSRLGIESL